jgi:mannose-6-phosphate isomerase-like protein (cupin superfamily)
MSLRVLMPCLVAAVMTTDAFAQTPAPPAQPPAQTPAQPPATPPATPPKKPASRRQQPAQSMVPTTVTVTITDASGAPVDNVHVSATGPVSRQTLSIDTGVARLNSVKPGDYRLRFEREGFITLERDLTIKGGSPASIDVSLTPAPPAPSAPEPPPASASAAANAPPGEAQSVSIVDFLEKNHFSGRDPQRVDQLGCTASAKTTLVQVKDDQPETSQKDADEVIYVVGGDGKMRLGNTDIALTAGSLAIVPRGTVRALSRKGRSPLIVLSILSGPPCTK